MSGQDEGGGGFKKKDHNLESDFTLDAGQEDVVCVDLDGEWSEQSKIFSHPSYKNPDIQFVSGEVGEGGDHMNLTFKNVSQHSVTITGDTIVVFVSEDPGEIDPNIKEGATNDQLEKEKESVLDFLDMDPDNLSDNDLKTFISTLFEHSKKVEALKEKTIQILTKRLRWKCFFCHFY